jgi:hypothetical protein
LLITLLFEGTCTSFSKIKSQKEVTKQLESRFFLLFFLVIEGSRSGSTLLRRAGKEPAVTHVLACLYNSSIAVPDPNPENRKRFQLQKKIDFLIEKNAS